MIATALNVRALCFDDLIAKFAAASRDDQPPYLTEIERRMRRMLPSWLTKLGVPNSEVDEFVQRTWLAVLQYRDSYQPGQNAYGWLKTIATREVHRDFRDSGRQKRTPCGREIFSLEDDMDEYMASVSSAESTAIRVEQRQAIRNKIAEFPDELRDTFALFHLHQMSHSAISELLDIPLNTVKTRLSRGMARLKESFDLPLSEFLED